MPNTILQALVFLISTAFDIYIYILVIRLILVWVYADYSLPITQFIIKTTTVLVKPLRQVIPDYRRLECATLALIILISMIKYLVIILLTFGFSHLTSMLGVVLLALADPVKCIVMVLSVAVLVQALMSWLQPNMPINRVLLQLTTPILQPLQRYIPPIGGIDVTPLIALILLQLVLILFVTPLQSEGWSIALT